MNKTSQAVLAALLLAGTSFTARHPAQAQILGDPNTSITGDTIYVEEESVDLTMPGHNGLTINGAMGLPLNPTAQMPVKGSARVQVNYYKLWDNGGPSAGANSKLYGVYAAAAITERLEVSAGLEKQSVSASGVNASAIEDAFDKSGIALGVKYLVNKPSRPGDVRVAIGAGVSKALYNNTHVYAVASKGFNARGRIITGHVGARWDRFKVNQSAVSSKVESSKASAFGGVEVPIDRKGRFSVVGEIQSRNTEDDLGDGMPYSLSVRFQNEQGLSANVGFMRQGVLSGIVSDDGGLFAQIGKTF